jgi:hypothetical protein
VGFVFERFHWQNLCTQYQREKLLGKRAIRESSNFLGDKGTRAAKPQSGQLKF